MFFVVMVLAASAREGEGAGRGPGGLRNSELGPLPHYKKNVKSSTYTFSCLLMQCRLPPSSITVRQSSPMTLRSGYTLSK